MEGAEKHANLLHAMFPDQLRPHLFLGLIYHAQGKFEESRKSLLKCIRRETQIQSLAVERVVQEATAVWKRFYGDNPPE